MLIIQDEAALHVYLEKWVQKRLGKAVFRRHFLAAVQSVSGVPGKYVVTVQRLDESQPDPNTYLCSTPFYKPQVGDTVDVLWFDDTLGYVMWPLSGPGVSTSTVPYRARATGGVQSIAVGSTPTICNINAELSDPNGNFNTTTYQYTAPVSGDYLIIGQAQWHLVGTGGGRLYSQIFIAGAGSSSGTPPDSGSNGVTSDVEDMLPVLAGQTIDLRVAHDRTTTQALYSSRLAVRYIGS